jgi:hypothetical protein
MLGLRYPSLSVEPRMSWTASDVSNRLLVSMMDGLIDLKRARLCARLDGCDVCAQKNT